MGHFDRLSSRLGISKVSQRVQTLSKVTSNRVRLHQKRILGIFLIFFSIPLGFWAEKIARSEAVQEWEKAHPPSRVIWEHAIGSRGFQKLQESKSLQKILKSLPSMIDDPGAIWLSSDRQWIVIFSQENELTETSQIYCVSCKNPTPGKIAWESLGIGWTGFEQVMKSLDANPTYSSRSIDKKKTTFSHDIREIRY